jgi:hypothetical protein
LLLARAAQRLPQALEGAQGPHLHRRRADAQDGGRLLRRKLFQVPQHQHLPVRLRQFVQGRTDAQPQFLAHHLFTRAARRIDQPAGQLRHRVVGQPE